MFPVPARNLL
jgi:hypothetical protein